MEAEPDLQAALNETQRLLDSDHDGPIFEGTFDHDGVLIRADVMEPDGAGGWHIAEVKSSTGVKDYHLGDMATQLWVLRNAGVEVSSAAIRHINNKFELQEVGNYNGLLTDTQMGDEIDVISGQRDNEVHNARETLGGNEPEIEMGDQCKSPFECEFQNHCFQQSGATSVEWPVSLLPRTGKRLSAEYEARGILELADVPDGELKHKNHEKIRLATINDEPFHDFESIVAETDEWEFPLIHLDFETSNMAIPRWIGTRPYQQIPFQFSAHIQPQDGDIEHIEFLDLSGNDPRPGCAMALSKLPAEGSVVAWYAPFERSRLKELAAIFPEYADALTSLADRLVDLKVIAEKHYYHRDQRGSWSIKNVLPTLAKELDYGALEVKAGGEAVEAYEEAISEDTSEERRSAIADALKVYCGRDTWAMLVVLGKLRGE